MNTVIRASSLPSYTDCPRRWAARTLVREITDAGYGIAENQPPSVGASVGTATHSGAAHIMGEKLRTGEPGNQTEAEQLALEGFGEAARAGVLWDEATPNVNDAQKQVVRMVRVFRHTIAEKAQP